MTCRIIRISSLCHGAVTVIYGEALEARLVRLVDRAQLRGARHGAVGRVDVAVAVGVGAERGHRLGRHRTVTAQW